MAATKLYLCSPPLPSLPTTRSSSSSSSSSYPTSRHRTNPSSNNAPRFTSSLLLPFLPPPSRRLCLQCALRRPYHQPEQDSFHKEALFGSDACWSLPAALQQQRIAPLLAHLTPPVLVKWTFIGAVVTAVLKSVYSCLSEPYFWMYGSWFFVVWPWPAVLGVGIWTLVAVWRQKKRKAKEWEQVAILAGTLTWLILVPLGHFHGYIEGWPLTFFFVYLWFFLLNSSARLRLYGDLKPGKQDEQWASSSPPRILQIAFTIAVAGGHWVAALEAPHLINSWNWNWPSRLAIFWLFLALALHYNAIYFLGKYSDRLVTPQTVVVFGPYRFVRHPIYSSYMLLFAAYCLALRAYRSLAFLLFACLLYYEHRIKLEEDMLVRTFPELYTSYRDKVTKKFFPFLY